MIALYLGNLAFGLLAGGIQLQTICIAGPIFQRSNICASLDSLGSGKGLPIGISETERVKITFKKSAFSLNKHDQCQGLICLDSGDGLIKHGLGIFGSLPTRESGG